MENLMDGELPQSDFLRYKKKIFYTLGALVFLFLFYFLFFSAPRNFPVGSIVNINEGAGLRSVSLKLVDENIIRSRIVFEAFIILYGGERHIIPADYFFERGIPVWQVARRISRGERHLAPIAVTIPEGFNALQIADAFIAKLPDFDKEKFLQVAREGYLFPDTYFFFTTDNEQDALRLMAANFEKKVSPLRPDIVSFGKSETDIIIMASLVEREAKGAADRGTVAGILWKRLGLGMPLQVDAALETYKTRGLPKEPIANPGLDSVKAAIYPEKSNYLYYLHDKEGGIHYAKTFEEHKANKLKYLK
ncbi:hypothetical protein A3E95_00410 [Candidatus Nomurabacteria bacterium RIFCSPHIGHO2_12_FULL_44_22b]|nr:MAG: hypothetical protein A3E95_00410 [Candidatus Nomurabacteria bacterium RIFCSPHIGHO2_12_FULL_44_22b]